MRVLLWNNTQKVPCHDVKALLPKQTVKRQQVCVIMTSSYTQKNIPEEALHAILVACTRIFLCVPEELLVHALVEGVPQEVAPEAVQPVHLIRQTWTCQCRTHNSAKQVWQDAVHSQSNIHHDLQPRHGALQHVLQCACCQTSRWQFTKVCLSLALCCPGCIKAILLPGMRTDIYTLH